MGEDTGGTPAKWPSIADYWPDAPHRIGPAPDVYHLDETPVPDDGTPVPEDETPPGGIAAAEGTAAPADEPRDPFEDLLLAEDLRAHPDELHWDGVTPAAPPGRRRGRLMATIALALLLLVGLTALIVVQLPGGPDDGTTTAAPPAANPAEPEAGGNESGGDETGGDDAGDGDEAGPLVADAPVAGGRTASAPLDGRAEATFALLTETTILSVRTTALDEELFRISTPEDGGVRPNAVTSADEVRLFLAPSGNEGATAEVEVLLSDQVRWSVRLLAGVHEGAVDLTGSAVAEVTLAGGATRIDLSLPSPSGTLPIRLTKGANQLTVRTPGRVPARAAIRQGAGTVRLDGRATNGIAKGEVVQSRDWQSATDRLDLDASAGLGTLTIEPA